MIGATCSPGVSEAVSCAHFWPVTAKAWFVATLMADDGASDAYLTTYTSDSAAELIPTITGMPGNLVEVHCFVPRQGRWRLHHISELWTGTLGQSSVVVFRDADGDLFCPEVPDCPATSILDRRLLRTVGRDSAAASSPTGGGSREPPRGDS